MIAKWILVIGGLDLAYQGLTGMSLVGSIFGNMTSIVNIVVFGGAAVVLGYRLLTMKKK